MSKIDEIKEKIDIVDIIGKNLNLSKKGQNYWAMCPFHDDTNPSMSISPDKQIFKCFVCGAGGDAIKFVSEFDKIPFTEAMGKLAKEAGVSYTVTNAKEVKYDDGQQKLIDVLRDATLFFQNAILTEAGEAALKYITGRGLTQEMINKFSIGYAPSDDSLIKFLASKGHSESTMINASVMSQGGNPFQKDRLVFPIKNEYGDVVAFSGRAMSSGALAKYINSTDSVVFNKSRTLYNFSDARQSIKKTKIVFVLEGFMDVIALSRVGIDNAVAIMGTALTSDHVTFLGTNEVILMLDSDEAGVKATVKSVQILLDHKVKTFVIKNSTGKDADELLEEGEQILNETILKRSTALDFIIRMHNRKYNEVNPGTNEEYLTSIVKYLKNATEIEKDFYISKISDMRNISKEIVSSRLGLPSQKDTQNIFIHTPIPPKPVSITTKLFRKRNYEFEMLHSMLLKSELIAIYEEAKPIHSDAMIQQIGKYLIKYVKRMTTDSPSSDMKRKIAEVKENSQGVTTTEEFREILKRVTKSSLNAEKDNNKLKLKHIKNSEERIALLEAIKILNKKIKEL